MPKLEDVNLNLELADENKQRKGGTEITSVTFNNVTLNLEITYSSHITPNDNTAGKVLIRASKIDGGAIPAGSLKIELLIQPGEDGRRICFVTSDVANYDRSLPKLGRALWDLIPKLTQKIADDNKIATIHLVKKSPSGTLKPEKWDEIFEQFLADRLYLPTDKQSHFKKNGYGWVKKYTPQK